MNAESMCLLQSLSNQSAAVSQAHPSIIDLTCFGFVLDTQEVPALHAGHQTCKMRFVPQYL